MTAIRKRKETSLAGAEVHYVERKRSYVQVGLDWTASLSTLNLVLQVIGSLEQPVYKQDTEMFKVVF